MIAVRSSRAATLSFACNPWSIQLLTTTAAWARIFRVSHELRSRARLFQCADLDSALRSFDSDDSPANFPATLPPLHVFRVWDLLLL